MWWLATHDFGNGDAAASETLPTGVSQDRETPDRIKPMAKRPTPLAEKITVRSTKDAEPPAKENAPPRRDSPRPARSTSLCTSIGDLKINLDRSLAAVRR